MNLHMNIILIMLTCISFQAFALSTLVVPYDVEILVVNMEKPKFKKGSDTQVELPDGTNQIVFKYLPQFSTKDVVKVVYSDVIIAKFDANNDTLSLKMPNFKSFREAQKKISSLSWEIVNQYGNNIDIYEDKLINNGVQIGRNYVEEARNYNITGGLAAVTVSYVTVNQFQHPVSKLNSHRAIGTTSSSDTQSVDLLKAIYMSLSPSDREEFQKWLLEQE
ncbi:hypothetical protein DLR72_03245 [Vibrio paracholerae]|uniref:DUF2057 domain-containing protein n=2 Tax=Vibrio paracholerae TaxID=650003 RepID=A0ABD7FYM7_9VIBR|nr:hypothetical protein DLR72_03245 [Vibrio paracholerae]